MFDGPRWPASLALRFRQAGGRPVFDARHRGPLRVQKPLYPEGGSICHAVLLHPPGGVAGGDSLDVSIEVEPDTHALITTPGASKWYKANGRVARQQVSLNVRGALEWLPQEAIVFDQAQVDSRIDISLAPGATMLGWDLVALGRAASGERFATGRFSQTIRLQIDGELQWIERTRIDGDDPLLASPIGLAGQHVFGCLWAAGVPFDDVALEAIRLELGAAANDVPLTRLSPHLLVARALGPSTASVRSALERVWSVLRPHVVQMPAQRPRLWST
ncbi:MAG: urease accessory protein UreD [Burkholderiaceae bacterium]